MGRFKKKEHRFPEEFALLSEEYIVGRSLPKEHPLCGIYFLIRETKIVYVGQSENLFVRVYAHCCQSQKDFDRYFLHPCPSHLLDRLEQYYIARFRPKYNVQLRDSSDLLPSSEELRIDGVNGVIAAVPPQLPQKSECSGF